MLTVVKPDINAKVLAAIEKFADGKGMHLGEGITLDVLGYDSLSRVELAMELEDVLGLEFQDLELEGAETIGDVLRIVRERAA